MKEKNIELQNQDYNDIVNYNHIKNKEIRKRISLYFQSRFFPPIHKDFVKPAFLSLFYIERYKPNKKIALPNGIVVSAKEIFNEYKLDEIL